MKKYLTLVLALVLSVSLVLPIFAEDIDDINTTEFTEEETTEISVIPEEDETEELSSEDIIQETETAIEEFSTEEVFEVFEIFEVFEEESKEEPTYETFTAVESETVPGIDGITPDDEREHQYTIEGGVKLGQCGADVMWSMGPDNALILFGNGTTYAITPTNTTYPSLFDYLPESLEIMEGITSIGDYLFYACSSIATISLPSTLEVIGNGAFYYCRSLPDFEFPKNLREIGESAFFQCTRLSNIAIPENVTTLGGSAFRKCSGLRVVKLPHDLTEIGYNCFLGCDGITDVYFDGTEAEWNAITFNPGNECLLNAERIHFNEEPETSTEEPSEEDTTEEDETEPDTTAEEVTTTTPPETQTEEETTTTEIETTEEPSSEDETTVEETTVEETTEEETTAEETTAEEVTTTTPPETSTEEPDTTEIETTEEPSSEDETTVEETTEEETTEEETTAEETTEEETTEVEVLPASKVVVDAAAEIGIGNELTLQVKVEPEEASQIVKYTSDNEAVVTVDENGVIKGIGRGTAAIHIVSEDGNAEAVCNVTVQFSDVLSLSKNFKNAINWLADQGIANGYGDGSFGESDPCTRKQFAIMLWGLAGKPAVSGSMKFDDCQGYSKNSATYKAILWASQQNIVSGYKDGSFRPEEKVTRQQVMIMLYRYAGKPAVSGPMKFTDVTAKAGTDTYNAILWGSNNGITSGTSATTFSPNQNCLRRQIAMFLYKF